MPRFIFDVDGVLLNFESSFIKVLKNLFNLDIPTDYESKSWFFSEILTRKQLEAGWANLLESDHFENLEPIVDSAQFNKMYQDCTVDLITNIPPKYQVKRAKNLKNVGLNYDTLNSGGFLSFDNNPPVTKAKVIKQISEKGETLFFLDDHPDNCKNVKEAFPDAHVYLMDRPFNEGKDHKDHPRVMNWDDIFEISRDIIANEAH